MLAETEMIYAVGWGGLGLVCGIIACSVYYSKGYTSEAIAGLIGGFICFPLGLLALIQGLAAVDKKQQQATAAAQRAANNNAWRLHRLEQEARERASEFFQCPRCGANNGLAQGACWQCQLPFASDSQNENAPPVVVAPPPVVVAPRPPLQQPASAMAPPAALVTAKEIKVRCKACGKKFGGTVAQIASLKACPRCKAAPFQSETVQP